MVLTLSLALVFTSLLAASLWVLYHRKTQALNAANEQLTLVQLERLEVRMMLANIVFVMNEKYGGIAKQVVECANVADLLHSEVPGLFTKHKNLPYLLHSQSQFLQELADATSAVLTPWQQRILEDCMTSDPERVFAQIFVNSSIPLPPGLAGTLT